MTEGTEGEPSHPTYWCCIRCGNWSQVNRDQLCRECSRALRRLSQQSALLRSNMHMFDGEEP